MASSLSSRQGQVQSSVGRAIILKGPNPNSRTYFTALPATLDSLILKARSLFPVPANHTPHITLGTDESAILLPDALPFLKERELLIFRWIPDTPTNQSRKGNANSNRVKWDSSILEAEKKQKEKEKEKLQPSNSNSNPNPTSSSTSSPPKNDTHPPSIIQSNISPPQLERISSAGNGAAGTARGPAARAAHVQRVLKEQREKAAREAEEEKEKEKEKEEMEHKQRLEEMKAIESQISELGNSKQKQKEVPGKEREEATAAKKVDEQNPPRVENEEEVSSQSLKDSETSIEVEKEGNVEPETISKDPEPQPSTPSVESSDPIPSFNPSSSSTSSIATATTDSHTSPTISEDQDQSEEEERSSPPPYTSPEQSQPRPQTQSESEPIQENNISNNNNKKLNEKKKAPSLVVVLPTPPSTAHRNSKTSKSQSITEDAQEREDQDVPSSPLSSPTTARVARSVISNAAASSISREKQKAAPVELEDIDQMQMDIMKGRLGSDSDDEEETVTDGAGVEAEESVESEIEMDVDEDEEEEDEDHVMELDSPTRIQEQKDIQESSETSQSQESDSVSVKGQEQDSEEKLETSRAYSGDSASAALDEDDHSVEEVIGMTTSTSTDLQEVSSNDDGGAAEEFQQDSEMTMPSLDDDDDRDEKVAVEVDQQAYTIMSQVLNGMKEHPCNTFFREAMQEEEKVAVEARGLVPIDFFSIKDSIESRSYSSLNYSSTISSATDEASRSSISNSEALARFSSDLSFMWNNTLQLYGERSSQYQCATMLSKFGETVMKEMSRKNSNPNKGSSSSQERNNGVRGSLFKNGESSSGSSSAASSSSKNQSGRTKAVRKAGLNPSATGGIMDIFNEQMNGRGNALLNGEFRLGRNGRTQGASANGNGSPHSRGEKRPITNPAFEIFLSQNKPLASRRSKNGGALPAQSAAFMAGAAAQRKLNGAPPLKRRATEGNRVVTGVTSNSNATLSTSSPPLSSSTSFEQVSQMESSFAEKQVSEERSLDNELEEMEEDDDDDVLTPPPPSKKEKAINHYKSNVLEKANQAAAAVLGVRR